MIILSLKTVFTNSRVLEPIVCSKTSMVEFAPTLVASRWLPSESIGGRLLMSQNRRRVGERCSISKPKRSISFPPEEDL